MTGWKDQLRQLDELGPSDGVYRRAREGPKRPLERPARGQRLAAGITAFAVFALAAAFAWRALGPVEKVDRLPVAEAGVLSSIPLWPERDTEVAAAVQEAIDGGDSSQAWRLDPGQVADRFAREVVGWTDPGVFPSLDESSDGTMKVEVSPCPRTVVCDLQYPMGLSIRLIQPPGLTLWSVSSVDGGGIDLQVKPGEVLPLGSEAVARLELGVGPFPSELDAGMGALVGGLPGSGCNSRFGTNDIRDDGSDDGSMAVKFVGGSDADLRVDCGLRPVGYVWVAIAPSASGAEAGDPLKGGDEFISLSIAPINVSIPENAASGSPSPDEIAVAVDTYTDPLGWSIDYPQGWSVLPIDWFNTRYSTMGAAFSNEPLVPAADEPGQGDPWPDLSRLTQDGVVLIITHRTGGPAPTFGDDSPFPLDPADAAILNAEPPLSRLLSFRGDGLEFSMEWGGFADGDPTNLAAIEEMIRTIRFEPWGEDETRNGFQAIDPASGFDERKGYVWSVRGKLGVIYVIHDPAGFHVLDLEPETCGEGQDQTWDPVAEQVLIECPDGSEIRYEPDGTPDPGNAAGFTQPLASHPAFVTWDGTLVVPGTTIDAS